jgi:hypothetical protein
VTRENENIPVKSELGVAAALEARRLAEKYGRDYLTCEDLVEILGLGMNNVRHMINGEDFPVIEVGNRKVISVIAFAFWQVKKAA